MLQRALPCITTAALLLAAPPTRAQTVASMTTEIVTEKKGKVDDKRSLTMTLVSDGADRFAFVTVPATGEEELTMIFNSAENKMTTVTTDGESAHATVVPLPKVRERDLRAFAGRIEPTTETREILGHTATKVMVYADDGTVTEAWVAEIPGLSYADLFGKMRGRGSEQLVPKLPEMPDAVALESHSTSKNGKEVTHTYVRSLATGADVDLSPLEIPASAEVMDLGSLGGILGSGGR